MTGRQIAAGLTVFGPDTAPPLVLVHGIRLSAAMWRPHARRLAPDFRVSTPDLPCHGALADRPFTLDEAVATVRRAVREAYGATGRRPLLAGLSLGGYVSLAHAARHPEDVAALLLHGCTARTTGRSGRAYAAAGRLNDRLGPERAARFQSWAMRRMLPPESAEAVLAGGFHLPALTEGVAELRRHDFLALAGRLTTPTLFLNGGSDLPFRADERRFLAAVRAAGTPARLFHTPGGHLLSLTDPDRFAALLRRAHRELLPAAG
ncbi:alpha/beta fold hydrolase [Kitasatospora sp. NA04385]|uniref:alpha/beta fold hydrolase n=1 Tax=Kitasatospora sp. NA04385 TaxID=2742135 RepID=UPI00158FB24F|nr:alpha/beta hydrolase [Kitasatospora sp. NA04385]QKW18466.1 alpha/beta fold hydrolase [Kitasatospora sp. NA04385]